METNKTNRTEDEYMRELYGVANKVGMRNNELYARFMVARFPNERHVNYMREWAFRFMSGDPTNNMDLSSIKIFLRLIKERSGLK